MTEKYDEQKQFKESDWKLFRSRIEIWQENYMKILNEEYIKILSQEGKPSDNFWQLDKRISKDKRKPGVAVNMCRSTMVLNILDLLKDKVIVIDDLNDFSDELKAVINRLK